MNCDQMNCDQVFDILTRGPFPTGTSCDVPVEAHLSECAECHQLAEALRPAIELFQEAVDPEESRDLPGYWCAVAEKQSPVLSYAREIEPRAVAAQFVGEPADPGHYSALTLWRMAAMVAVGITVGTLMSARTLDGFNWPPRNGGAVGAPAAGDELPSNTNFARMELAALSAACFEHRPERSPRYSVEEKSLLEGAGLENLSCCSGCHNSGSDKVTSAQTMRVVQACQYCHVDRSANLHSGQ
jgi:hypothetical protein